MARKTFTPWRKDFQRAFFLWLIGSGLLAAAVTHLFEISMVFRLVLAGLAALSFIMGHGAYRSGAARLHGKRVEELAVKRLRKVLKRSVSIEHSVLIPGYGDADIVVTSSQGRWVVEVKSHVAVRVNRGMFGRCQVVRPAPQNKGEKPFPDIDSMLSQAARNAAILKGSPILWFPAGRVATHGTVDGVLVVTGPATHLAAKAGMPRSGLFERWLPGASEDASPEN